ncbi:hypothetical protein DSO57_1006641 [Entomophthora muscae]|uniref:Uncharacterized protein n=1 Tax=Entomophthora muscae TaxID=34485 RepID=A0ACC2U6L2_9FUNG|nr:hypothetical protein DSO57_1006641 [Entomophthora muscae]
MSIPPPSTINTFEQSANPELPCTLGLDLQANAPIYNNSQLYLPLAVSVAYFKWYPPEACSSGAVGFAGRCLEHFHGLAHQSKVSLPAFYSYIEDVLLNCLTIGVAFSPCGGWGRLVNKFNLCLPLCGWTSMSRNSQLAWCQMLVALAFVCNQMNNDDYKLLSFHPPIFPRTALLPQVPLARLQAIVPFFWLQTLSS